MKKYLLTLILPFVLFTIHIMTFSQGNQNLDLREGVESLQIFEYYDSIIPVLMKEQNIPALSIALVDKEGIVWSSCFGHIGPESPNNPESMFSIQSISKTFTSTAILMAVEAGLLDLDTPVSEYIPEFNIPSYFDKEPMGIITLRHLLSHTAGLTHEAPVGNNYTYDSPTFEEHVNSIQQTYLRYPVGQRYSYSNLGVDLAAYILQEVSGEPFHQYLKEHLFDPLEMKNSSANPEVILAMKNRAAGHSGRGEEKRVIVPMMGAGGVYLSIDDMAKFVQFHLNLGEVNGKKLIEPSLLEEMYTVPFPVKGQTSGYALGIDTYEKYNSLFLNHGGGGYGYLADMAWYKEYGIGAVVLTNSVNHNLQGILYHEILDKILQSSIRESPLKSEDQYVQEITLSEEDMQRLSGNYLGRNGSTQVVIEGASMGIQTGGEFVPLAFYTKNEAMILRQSYKDYYRFVSDDMGNPNYIVQLNGGRTWDYNDGPFDGKGPDNPQWAQYLGDYGVLLGGTPMARARIETKNGYLYVSYMNQSDRLKEVEPGVFISVKGEVLKFGKEIKFASIFELVRTVQE